MPSAAVAYETWLLTVISAVDMVAVRGGGHAIKLTRLFRQNKQEKNHEENYCCPVHPEG
jgi:hypothetical protein